MVCIGCPSLLVASEPMKIEAPQPGTIIGGKYVVEGLLGAGGMGVVLSARHQQLDQRVAIKLLLKEAREHPEVLERFMREARAAAKIHGEHIARVIDVGELSDGAPYMVMEYLEGHDLAALLKTRGPLAPGTIASFVIQACDAIAQAHAAKIVHRDLKPGNLFLARQPDGMSVIKVLDFGISKLIEPDGPMLTKTSSLVGTPFYMSPEQLTAAKSVDSRADIWALGVIMYELSVGAPPFGGDSMPAIVAAILQNEPAPLDQVRSGLPPGFSDIVARCMRSKADERYPHVAAVAAALAPFASSIDAELMRAQKIARVLGVEDPLQATLPPDTELAPTDAAPVVRSSAEAALVEVVSDAPEVTPQAPHDRTLVIDSGQRDDAASSLDATRASPLEPKTQLGVAASAAPPPVRSRARLVSVAAGLLAITGGVALSTRPHGDPVKSPASADPLQTDLAPSIASNITEPPSARLVVSATPTASASASASASAPTARPRPSSFVLSHGSAEPAPAPPPSTSSTPKNPLDMRLK